MAHNRGEEIKIKYSIRVLRNCPFPRVSHGKNPFFPRCVGKTSVFSLTKGSPSPSGKPNIHQTPMLQFSFSSFLKGGEFLFLLLPTLSRKETFKVFPTALAKIPQEGRIFSCFSGWRRKWRERVKNELFSGQSDTVSQIGQNVCRNDAVEKWEENRLFFVREK